MRFAALLIAACALLSCAAPFSGEKGEKGGLRAAKLSSEALDAAFEPRRFALAIGISQFDDPEWRTLKFASKDATDFAAALADPSRGHFDKVVSLTSPADTTKEKILSALDSLAQQANRPDDIVVVYVSAHGTLARDTKGELRRYLVTRDASYRDIPSTALSMDALETRLSEAGSRRRLLVLATCHSGNGKSLLPADLAKELEGIKAGFYAKPLEDVSRAAMVLAASDWGETAREDESLQNDIYTYFLLQALDGGAGDRNNDGAVSAYEAHDYARRKTFEFTQGRQRPSAEVMEVGADPILLSGRLQRTGNPELYSYNQRLDGFTLKVDGDPKAELPGGVAVQPGARKVELTKGDELFFSRSMTLVAGERLDIDALVREAVPHRTAYLMGGAIGFVDAKSRHDIAGPAPQAGISLRWDDLPWRDFSLWADVGGGFGRQTLDLGDAGTLDFDFRSVNAGVSLPWHYAHGRFHLFAGPRVAGLYIQRSFDTAAFSKTQEYLTVSPGLMAGLSFQLTERLELSAQGNLMLTWVVVDGVGSAVGFSGGWAGVGYKF